MMNRFQTLLSNFAFKFNLRLYTTGAARDDGPQLPRSEAARRSKAGSARFTVALEVNGRGLHSSPFQLNVSRF